MQPIFALDSPSIEMYSNSFCMSICFEILGIGTHFYIQLCRAVICELSTGIQQPWMIRPWQNKLCMGLYSCASSIKFMRESCSPRIEIQYCTEFSDSPQASNSTSKQIILSVDIFLLFIRTQEIHTWNVFSFNPPSYIAMYTPTHIIFHLYLSFYLRIIVEWISLVLKREMNHPEINFNQNISKFNIEVQKWEKCCYLWSSSSSNV